jgi:radical SAM superfamily enzyme YgiQ (UPF0313 family)
MSCFFEIGPIRPPNEDRDCSLLIRATRNCPWNRCLFCPVYKKDKFALRSFEEIKRDINAARWIKDRIEAIAEKDSLRGVKLDCLVREMLESDGYNDVNFEWNIRNNIINVANWLSSGARTVFLQDADSLIMRTPDLVEVLKHLKATFPNLDRCSSYARAKTCFKKTVSELEDLHEAGLSRLHLGLESGNDLVLEFMQ